MDAVLGREHQGARRPVPCRAGPGRALIWLYEVRPRSPCNTLAALNARQAYAGATASPPPPEEPETDLFVSSCAHVGDGFGTVRALVERGSRAGTSWDGRRNRLRTRLLDGRLSLGQAARLAGYSKRGFMEALGKLGTPVYDRPAGELKDEIDL